MTINRVNFLSETEFEIGKFRFVYSSTDYSVKTSNDRIALLKTPEFIRYYEDLLEEESISNVLEVGVFQGGMAILLPLIKSDIRYLGMDIMQELPIVTETIENHEDMKERSHILFSFPQGDPRTQTEIEEYFGGDKLDLVIDDASHMYEFTKKAFELIFPKLRPGGRYIIEDWSWMHWPSYSPPSEWLEEPPLTDLLMELCGACGEGSGVISKIEVLPSMFVIHKGTGEIASDWKFESSVMSFQARKLSHELASCRMGLGELSTEVQALRSDASARRSKLAEWIDKCDYRMYHFASRLPFINENMAGRLRTAAQLRKRSKYDHN